MKIDLFPYLNYLFTFRFPMVNNLGYAVSALCYFIIFLKIRNSHTGSVFRLFLMGYFGAAVITSVCMVLYHPLYNPWLLPAAHSVVFVALLALTGYILNEFWSKKPK